MDKQATTTIVGGLRVPTASFAAFNRAGMSPLWIVFGGGLNLVLIQWVLVREMTALLFGTELVILLVSIAYFSGLSVGFLLSGRVGRRWLAPLAVVTLALHLTLPVWFRLMVAGLSAANVYWAAFLVLPVVTPFVVSAFYSVFLPLLADSGEGELPALYGVELLGAAVGVVALVLLGSVGMQAVYVVYTLGLLVILLALGLPARRVALLGAAAAVWLVGLPGLNYWSNTLWYEELVGLPPGTRTLFTGYSPYQKVDVLETPIGGRHLYLDGLSHFNSSGGIRINVILGEIPNALFQPQRALVIGAGAMQTEQIIAQTAEEVTTVEIDPLVVEAALRYFTDFNQMDVLTNRRVVVDDAKHFLANEAGQYDLIVGDTPAAFTIQTATLYSLPFYQEVERRLAPGGVFATNMTSPFALDDAVSRRIAASLLAVFDEVIVITPASVGWSFAYAGDRLPFDRVMVEEALRASGEFQFIIYDTPAVRALTGRAVPITLDSMDIVLQVSSDWIMDRLE